MASDNKASLVFLYEHFRLIKIDDHFIAEQSASVDHQALLFLFFLNLLHDPVNLPAERDECPDFILSRQFLMVLNELIDQLLSLSYKNVDAEKGGDQILGRGHPPVEHGRGRSRDHLEDGPRLLQLQLLQLLLLPVRGRVLILLLPLNRLLSIHSWMGMMMVASSFDDGGGRGR